MRLMLLMRLVLLCGSECHVQCIGHLVVGVYCDAAIPLLGYLAEPGDSHAVSWADGSCGLVVLGRRQSWADEVLGCEERGRQGHRTA
ncbi:hypothetical protein BC831DRAFT_457168 [Entophlyctis helioformis]|nr:hypothetical protein BC831DRAFT_457168 [Entophlyctis helioformis]